MSKLRRVQFDNDDDDDELVQASRAISAEQLAMNPADRVINNDFYVREIARHYPGSFNKLARLDKRLNNLLTGDASRGFRREMMEELITKKTEFREILVNFTVQKYKTEKYFFNGKLHREGDLPAYVETDVTDPLKEKLVEEAWYTHGKIHRIGGPSEIVYFDDGNRMESFYEDGVLLMRHDIGAGWRTYYNADERPSYTIHADGRVDDHRLYDEDYGNWDDNDGPEL